MIHLSLLLVGFLLGIFACAILLVLMLAHRPLYTPTTMYRRRRLDRQERLGPEFERVLHENLWDLYATDSKTTEPFYMYGVTGEER
jgi:hypothetical protein